MYYEDYIQEAIERVDLIRAYDPDCDWIDAVKKEADFLALSNTEPCLEMPILSPYNTLQF